jgi:hypothetical protein
MLSDPVSGHGASPSLLAEPGRLADLRGAYASPFF